MFGACYVLGGVNVISEVMLINVFSLQYMLWLAPPPHLLRKGIPSPTLGVT